MTKVCRTCEEEKPIAEFYKSGRDKKTEVTTYRGSCKVCYLKRTRELRLVECPTGCGRMAWKKQKGRSGKCVECGDPRRKHGDWVAPDLSDVQRAWLAGIYEGEGTISYHKAYGKNFRIQVQMTDKDVLLRCQEWTGCGNIYETKKQQSHHKQAWLWVVAVKAQREWLVDQMWEFLCERRRQRIATVWPRG